MLWIYFLFNEFFISFSLMGFLSSCFGFEALVMVGVGFFIYGMVSPIFTVGSHMEDYLYHTLEKVRGVFTSLL